MQWKVATIILILKPGKPPPPHEPTSYRPISLLPILSKVFEKILLEGLSSSKYKINSYYQTTNSASDRDFLPYTKLIA
jgi:hypothetical protein